MELSRAEVGWERWKVRRAQEDGGHATDGEVEGQVSLGRVKKFILINYALKHKRSVQIPVIKGVNRCSDLALIWPDTALAQRPY